MSRIVVFFLAITLNCFAQFQNVQVNKIESSDPEEVTIAINPQNPEQLAAGANISYFYSSNDSGKTWNEKKLSSSLGVWGDPVVIYNNKGELFFSHLSNPTEGHWIDRIVVQKSTDNGQIWSDGAGIGFKNFPIVQDKEWLAVDNSNSIYRDNIYMTWTEFDNYGSVNPEDSSRIRFAKSINDGEIWSDPIVISDISGDCIDDDLTVEGAVPAIGPNGEIYTSWSGPLGIVFDKSLDGGETFGSDIFVTDQPGGWAFDVSGIYRCNGFPITACDISESPYKGNIYINWSDQRNGENNTDIFIIKSTDGGDTWGEIKKVNNDNLERHQFFSWMSVDPITGNIYVVFYDRRNTSNLDTEVYLAKSTDGGNSFENYRISESPFSPTSDIFFGDYTNIAAYNGIVRPIWMRLDSWKLSVWTSLINDSKLTSINTEPIKTPQEFKLFQNYPNPFNPSTIISYQLPESAYIEISIYDILGELVKTLEKGIKPAGIHELKFSANDIKSGLYFCRMMSEDHINIKKMILLK